MHLELAVVLIISLLALASLVRRRRHVPLSLFLNLADRLPSGYPTTTLATRSCFVRCSSYSRSQPVGVARRGQPGLQLAAPPFADP
jgi:hypothetical protein